ncbi:MAG: pyruvate ferredoxin oxidoreductase beta subunit [Moorella sp. (in: firmicutes)]|uniref:thiamine pyrophosphate-dependent enzyme n=1 Tax=Moorella sp. E306M TaxID=2572683 RepID=UPI0010FFB5BB|nr:thiamine pyrophosphate-dependent enzyme [Moorella sp. E306M]MDK2817128.1 pyruvate ferredoxin oxidoreductase beta subunit [Moorella sp. (in: firmicutes)]GEA18375.1 pyruvate ferredoxin oxidoreductase subunit beta [Moorella sp. E306M]
MEVYKTLAEIPQDEFFTGGHGGCRGCGAALAVRQAMKALGPRTIVTIPASCMATIGGSGLSTAWEIPFYHSLFECAPAVASGIRAALDIQGIKDVNVVSWAGDAGTADIGFQSLTGAAERQENIIHVCYDNETYMNTGGQAGSVTPYQAVTPDTPAGKPTPRKDMLAIMAAHHPAYLATASVAYPLDLIRKFQKARAIQGFRYIHILAPCFRGWGIREDQTVQLARLAVECGLWQLYEEIGGRRRVTVVPERRIPVREYLRLQGRFKNMDEAAVEALQAEADRRFQEVQS